MHFPAGGTRERLAADVTRIGFLTGVGSDVLPKCGLARQLHTALLADVFSFVLLHVAVQVLLGLEFLLAYGARELGVFHRVIVILVEVEGDLVRHFGAAHVAYARLSVVCDHVLHEIGLYAKLPIALVAGEREIDGVFAHYVNLQVGGVDCRKVAILAIVQKRLPVYSQFMSG